MKGSFFGAEQISPTEVGLDYDDDYSRVEGVLVPLTCDQPDAEVPGSDVSGDPDGWQRAIDAADRSPCPVCGAPRHLAAATSPYGGPAMHARVVRCPTAAATAEAARKGETGPVYRYRPYRIDPLPKQ